MYQSGCVPAETGEGSYGPYTQIGLIVTVAATSTMTPKMMKKKPPAFAANTGMIGTPTTLSFVRPGPENWVCLFTTSSTMCTPIRATMIAGSSRMWRL
jgi:hypothetical protein